MMWSLNKLVQLYRRIDVTVEEYEAHCHLAAARVAPRDTLWQAEAAWAAEARQRMRARATDWIEYATNRDVESLRSHIETDNA